ncbi:hypothetical protein EDC04DRAFT_1273664 [Pisolithus marmoratus]|nr:hypothetical protein EDC04DRAFT_1273664 [Pisolithus marmoratus]
MAVSGFPTPLRVSVWASLIAFEIRAEGLLPSISKLCRSPCRSIVVGGTLIWDSMASRRSRYADAAGTNRGMSHFGTLGVRGKRTGVSSDIWFSLQLLPSDTYVPTLFHIPDTLRL